MAPPLQNRHAVSNRKKLRKMSSIQSENVVLYFTGKPIHRQLFATNPELFRVNKDKDCFKVNNGSGGAAADGGGGVQKVRGKRHRPERVTSSHECKGHQLPEQTGPKTEDRQAAGSML